MAKNDGTQIDLFTPETPYVAEWMKTRTAFDPALAQKWKFEKMALAAASPARQELLSLVRAALRQIAFSREDRCVTSDDGAAWLLAHGYSPSDLGNAAGSIFKGGSWKLIGYRMSDRVSRHRNKVGIWQLKSGQ
jgi:hypothetical protein